MNNKIIVALGVVIMVSATGIAYAQQRVGAPAQINTEAREEIQQQRTEINREVQQQREEVRNEAQKKQQELQQETQQKREELRTEVQKMTASGTLLTEEMRNEIDQKREELRNELQQKHQEVIQEIQKAHDDVKEKIASARNQLQEQVRAIKDEQKQRIVLSTQDAFAALNEKIATQLLNTVNRLENLIPSIQSRIDILNQQGKNVSSAQALLVAAKEKLTAAQNAITAQAANVYTITITNADQPRGDVAAVRQKLNSDLLVVRDAVKAVRDIIHQAVEGINDTSTATSTGQ